MSANGEHEHPHDDDQGEHSHPPKAADRGPVGRTGQTGAVGHEGARGPSSFNRQTISVIAVFVLVAFLVLAWRSEVNDAEIAKNTVRIEQARIESERVSCESGVAVLRRFNDQQAKLGRADQTYLELLRSEGSTNEGLQTLLETRVGLYEAANEPLPDCSRLPGGRAEGASDVLDGGQLTAVQLLQP